MKLKGRGALALAMAAASFGGLTGGALSSPAPAGRAPSQAEQGLGNAREAQRHAHPGGGHAFHESGPCEGAWASPETPGVCVHADFVDPEVSNLGADAIETFSTNYQNELLGPDYCSGPTPGNRFRVLYVTTGDRSNRYSTVKDTLQEKMELADYYLYESARQTGGTRHLRYVCDTSVLVTPLTAEDRIVIDNVTLPNSADDSYDDTKRALRNAGYNNSNRKYIAFVDWKECCNADGSRKDNVGGRAEIWADDRFGQDNPNNNGNMIGVMYLRACTNCEASIALHEMVHNLGGVQKTAPRHDGQNTFHPRDEYDRMAYGGNTWVRCTDTAQEYRLDCADDDYFHTSPSSSSYLGTKWNVARNRFLVGGG